MTAGKPVIYRRGVAPVPTTHSPSSSDDSESEQEKATKPMIDKRLQRLEEDNIVSDRRKDKVKVENDEMDSEEDRRRRIRQRALERRKVAEVPINQIEDPVEKQVKPSSSSSEYSSGSDSETDEEPQVRSKPVFIPKESRETIAEKERLAAEEESRKFQKEEKDAERKKQAEELLLEILRNEMKEAETTLEKIELNDEDGIDEEEEFNAWKLRELLRIKRDREEREMKFVDEEDIIRRREMTDQEIAEENTKDGKLNAEKKKAKFLQKYYHKGAFYNDDVAVNAALDKTDALAPTLEDHADKTALPSILQVKNFGKAGRTKYTHLVDQDTTGLDAAWAKEENFSNRTRNKMGGMNSGFTKPTVKKRKI